MQKRAKPDLPEPDQTVRRWMPTAQLTGSLARETVSRSAEFTKSNETLRDRPSMSGVLFYTHLILFNQVSTLTGAAKRYVSVVGTGKI